MALDTKKWLKSLGFDDAAVDTLAPQFEPRAGEIEKQVLMRGDYDRFSRENKDLQIELKATSDRLNQEMVEWADLKNKDGEQANELRTRLEATVNERDLLKNRLVTLAEEQGLDPEKVIPKVTGAPNPQPKGSEVDLSGIQTQIGGVADYMLTLSAELPAIAQEHFELTGERLDTRAFVAGIKEDLKHKKTDNLDPVKRWESQFGIPAKRQEKQTASRAAEIAQAEERGATKARSELSIPGQNPPGRQSPVFTKLVPEGQAPKLARTQPGANTRSFAASLGSHKYRQPAGAGGTK